MWMLKVIFACVHNAGRMTEVGIDLSQAKPRKLTDELAQEVQLLVTMGCGDKCPMSPDCAVTIGPLQDPKGLVLGASAGDTRRNQASR